jgi:hypothetical protein
MESVTAEMLDVLIGAALFCILAVGGWALCSLACFVRDAVRRVINKKGKKERKDE